MTVRILLVEGLLAAGFLACSKQAAHDKPAPAPPAPEKRIRVIFGEQGGYTGDYRGFRIEDDGTVFRLRRKPAQETAADSLGRATPGQKSELRAMIAESGFAGIRYREHGNLTYSIEIETDSVGQNVSWPRGDQNAPEAAKSLYRNLRSWVRKTAVRDTTDKQPERNP